MVKTDFLNFFFKKWRFFIEFFEKKKLEKNGQSRPTLTKCGSQITQNKSNT
jgi:hypothetical protein